MLHTISVLASREITTKEGARIWLRSQNEKETADTLHDLVVGGAFEAFMFVYNNGCLLTESIVGELKSVLECPDREEFKKEMVKYKLYSYSLFGIKLGRFALSFKALKTLPEKENVFYKILGDRLKGSKFDPYLRVIPNDDVE